MTKLRAVGISRVLDYSAYYEYTGRQTSTQGADDYVCGGGTFSFACTSCGHLESNMSTLGKSGHPESNVSTLGMSEWASGKRERVDQWIHNASSHAHFSDVFCQFEGVLSMHLTGSSGKSQLLPAKESEQRRGK